MILWGILIVTYWLHHLHSWRNSTRRVYACRCAWFTPGVPLTPPLCKWPLVYNSSLCADSLKHAYISLITLGISYICVQQIRICIRALLFVLLVVYVLLINQLTTKHRQLESRQVHERYKCWLGAVPFFFLNLIYLMRFSQAIKCIFYDYLKAHLGYKSCPRTLGREDLVYGGTRTHDLVVGSPVP